jgi:clan AA aspartic protease
MGIVYAKISLTNGEDLSLFKRNIISKDEVREITATMVVDTGSYMMAINEETMTQLGMVPYENRSAQFADGSVITLPIVSPIHVKFDNRTATCSAMVLPGSTEMLLGAIPMEEMDVLIHPQKNEMIVNPAHPYIAQLSLK